jgi:hypothetical protein
LLLLLRPIRLGVLPDNPAVPANGFGKDIVPLFLVFVVEGIRGDAFPSYSIPEAAVADPELPYRAAAKVAYLGVLPLATAAALEWPSLLPVPGSISISVSLSVSVTAPPSSSSSPSVSSIILPEVNCPLSDRVKEGVGDLQLERLGKRAEEEGGDRPVAVSGA